MMNLIRQAVARGWCTDRNSHKEMDGDLAEDIASSINEVLHLDKPPFGYRMSDECKADLDLIDRYSSRPLRS